MPKQLVKKNGTLVVLPDVEVKAQRRVRMTIEIPFTEDSRRVTIDDLNWAMRLGVTAIRDYLEQICDPPYEIDNHVEATAEYGYIHERKKHWL